MAEQFFADFTRIVKDDFLFKSVANINCKCSFANKNYVPWYLSRTK